jgi:choline dehydrogenase-like flavoprotein
MTIDADVIVVELGVGGEFVAGRLAEAGLGVVGIESALGRRRMPILGMRSEQDDHA